MNKSEPNLKPKRTLVDEASPRPFVETNRDHEPKQEAGMYDKLKAELSGTLIRFDVLPRNEPQLTNLSSVAQAIQALAELLHDVMGKVSGFSAEQLQREFHGFNDSQVLADLNMVRCALSWIRARLDAFRDAETASYLQFLEDEDRRKSSSSPDDF